MNIRTVTTRALMDDGKELSVVITLRDGYTQLPVPQVLIRCGGKAFSPSGIQVDYAR